MLGSMDRVCGRTRAEDHFVARRTNYSYERMQRDRAKVAKRDAKREARSARKRGELVDGVETDADGELVPAALDGVAVEGAVDADEAPPKDVE
jgi:hypothetical protein